MFLKCHFATFFIQISCADLGRAEQHPVPMNKGMHPRLSSPLMSEQLIHLPENSIVTIQPLS